MELIRINPEEIEIGQRLPWSVYCAERALLLQKGTLISATMGISSFVERGLFRPLNTDEAVKSNPEPQARKKHLNPFDAKKVWSNELTGLLSSIATGSAEDMPERIIRLAECLQDACEQDADTILAAVHLSRGYAYTVVHPLHTAILSELLAKRLDLPRHERSSILAAALTMNVGMLELQDVLFEQKSPLTDVQKKEIYRHPTQSVTLLEKAGVNDPLWLEAVKSHHERVDGSGYPKRLSEDQIIQAAKIIALADVYSAMVTPRAHRKPLMPNEALKSVFQKRGKEVDESLATHFIREVGVFPPGAFVRLANGDTAVVKKRAVVKKNRDSTAPIVYSLISPRGGVYETPHQRDCSQAQFKITEMCSQNLSESVDPMSIWHSGS